MPGYERVNSSAVTVWVALQGHPEECMSAARAEFMTAHTNNLQSGNGCCSSCNHGTLRCGSSDGFCGLIFNSLVKELLKLHTSAGGSLLLKQLFLPSERCDEGYTCIRAFKISLSVCRYLYRLWIFYLHLFKPEYGNNKTV